MAPKSTGRMLRTSISTSATLAQLSKEALCLFFLLLPHFDLHGKMQANPYTVKGAVCPLIDFLTVDVIKGCLQEISAKTNVKYFNHNQSGIWYLHALEWDDHQDMRKARRGKDLLPDAPQAAAYRNQVSQTPAPDPDDRDPFGLPGNGRDNAGQSPGKEPAENDPNDEPGSSPAKAQTDCLDIAGSLPGICLLKVEGEDQVELKDLPPTPHRLKIERVGSADAEGEVFLPKKEPDERIKGMIEVCRLLWAELGQDTSCLTVASRNVREAVSLLKMCPDSSRFKTSLHWLVTQSRSRDAVMKAVRRKGLAGIRDYWSVVEEYGPLRPGAPAANLPSVSGSAYVDKILAGTARIQTDAGELIVPGSELSWDKASRIFGYRGQRFDQCFVRLFEAEAA